MSTHSLGRYIANLTITIILSGIQILPVLSQVTNNSGSLEFIKGLANKTLVKEFRSDSILVKAFGSKFNFSENKLIPIRNISSITISYGKNRFEALLNGVIIGALMGTFLGAILASEDKGFQVPSGLAIAGANLITIPIGMAISKGAKKKKRFIINGQISSYKNQVNEMNMLFTGIK